MRQYVIFLNRRIFIENVRWTQFKTLATDHVGIRQRNEHRLRCRWNEPRELLNWVSAKTLAQTRKTKEKKNNHTNNESRMFAADRCALCVSRDDVHPNSCMVLRCAFGVACWLLLWNTIPFGNASSILCKIYVFNVQVMVWHSPLYDVCIYAKIIRRFLLFTWYTWPIIIRMHSN